MTGQMLDFLGWFARPIGCVSLSPLSGSYSRTSHGRWFIFPFRPFPLSCAIVQLWPSANNINSKRYCCGPMAGLVFKWNTCPFASSSHHHLLLSLFSRGFWCRRSTRVVRACRAATTAPDSGLTSGGKSLFKKKQCRLNHFISLRSLSSSSNISCVTHTKESFPLFLFCFSFGKKHIWPVVKRSHGQNNNTNGDGCGGLSLMRARIPTDVMCSIRDGGTMLTLAGWIEKQTKKVQLFTKVWAKK